ncbi:superoxide dismutase [Verrucomicrobium sp. BvORR034]|uniref:superoxide dismutase n=1 Tax=Verrucomicrobium sp. BvORR034 TaxID=1396418 RepID=UPI002240EFB5|nr:superoxide dismutase [Verrucomicrobium sp. BvORR034]
MNRRAFLALAGGSMVGGVHSEETTPPIAQGVPLHLEPLAFEPEALEPYIDAQTMRLHYEVHHAAYLNRLQAALREGNLRAANAFSLIRGLKHPPASVTPELQTSLRQNGGGHVNHTIFWRILTPPGKSPQGPQGRLAEAIQKEYGSLDTFKSVFAAAAMKRFGSGWAWLSVREDGKLIVTSTPDQDNPAMCGLVPDEECGLPILGLDVWEHAYYLKYQNRRQDYVSAWWNVVNWTRVERNFAVVTAR